MTLRDDLLAERGKIDRKLAILNRIGEDTFPIGTVALFSSAAGDKWYYLKEGEESWRYLNGSNVGGNKQLRKWILDAEDANIGYFEVYRMNAASTPFYTTS